MQQVTDRIEKKLQDTPNLYYLKSYTVAGTSTVFVYLLESTPKKDVPDLWYQVRRKSAISGRLLPQGIVGPFLTTNSATPTGSSMASRRRTSVTGNARLPEEARSRLLRVKDARKPNSWAPGRADLCRILSHRLAELGMDRMELVQALYPERHDPLRRDPDKE